MTAIRSNVTPANHAEILRLTEVARDAARERRDLLQAAFERRTAPKTDYDDDMATVSGIRRKTTAYQAKREQQKFDRDMDAYKAFQAAERHLAGLELRVKHLRAVVPVPYTEDELRSATGVRTNEGWYRLLKVNKVTVAVDAGFPWPHKIARDCVLEVR